MTKLRKIGKVRIVDNEYIIKEEKDLTELYNYLNSRDIKSFIPIIKRENEENHYQYIEDYSINNNQKSEDLIKEIALIHNKTSHNKQVSTATYQTIYKKIKGYINYLDKYYSDLVTEFEFHEFNSPSEQILLNNYSKISELFYFLKKESDNWYKLVSNKTKQRVCLNHGKLETSHLITNKNNYLISLDNYNFSSPINDLVTYYKKEWEVVDFEELFKIYFEHMKLSEDELKLLFINISIPDKYVIKVNEFENTKNIRRIVEYIFNTEKLLAPYYTKNNKEE